MEAIWRPFSFLVTEDAFPEHGFCQSGMSYLLLKKRISSKILLPLKLSEDFAKISGIQLQVIMNQLNFSFYLLLFHFLQNFHAFISLLRNDSLLPTMSKLDIFA